MKIDCISDLHGHHPQLMGGDLLIVAGDLTASDKPHQFKKFSQWLHKQDYRHKIVIAGNHDGILERFPDDMMPFTTILEDGTECPFAHYLCNSGITIEDLNIWGSPYTPKYYDWSFMCERGSEIKQHWDLIPLNTDILITHGPPHGILDLAPRYKRPDENCGCEMLMDAVKRIKPVLHVFGHIHEGYGMHEETWQHDSEETTLFVNAAIMDRNYSPVNAVSRIEI